LFTQHRTAQDRTGHDRAEDGINVQRQRKTQRERERERERETA